VTRVFFPFFFLHLSPAATPPPALSFRHAHCAKFAAGCRHAVVRRHGFSFSLSLRASHPDMSEWFRRLY